MTGTPRTPETVRPDGTGWLHSLARQRFVSPDSVWFRPIIAVTIAFVVIGSAASFRGLDLTIDRLSPAWLLAALVAGVLLLPLNAREYQLSGRAAGIDVPLGSAVSTTVLGAAANILPLPAGAAIRVQGLRELGGSTGAAAGATVLPGLAWLGATATLTGPVLYREGEVVAGAVFGAGAVACWVALAAVVRRRRLAHRWLVELVVIEALFLGVAALRFHLVVRGLAETTTVAQSVVVAASGSLAAAAGVLPGAIGITELLASALGGLVDLPLALGFLAAATLRLLSAAVFVTASAVIGTRGSKGRLDAC